MTDTDPALRAQNPYLPGEEASPYEAWQEGYDTALAAAAEAAPLDVGQPLWDLWTTGEKLAYGVGFRRGAAAAPLDMERLARAIRRVIGLSLGEPNQYLGHINAALPHKPFTEQVAGIAREYAALRSPDTETDR
jgi:hypothetical protein